MLFKALKTCTFVGIGYWTASNIAEVIRKRNNLNENTNKIPEHTTRSIDKLTKMDKFMAKMYRKSDFAGEDETFRYWA